MQLSEIKRILGLMKENDLAEFEMQDGEFRIHIKRGASGAPVIMQQSPMMMQAPAAAPAPAAPAAAPVPEAAPAAGPVIKSPIVGTFYRSSSPEAEPFVSVGKEVGPDTVVCIIEAMKVMNEIKAEVKGVIRKILVDNATPVQYGQALFEVEPR
ncbi:MAG: acetyl-CoA carboxylase biotin carboxyl carrier protein [Kiritimatiellia bacterium]